MRQSTRLILNTGATYVRMALTVGIGLLATRWALHTLGNVDFGVWVGLTATVSLVLVFSEGVCGAVERFLAFEIGRGDPRRKHEFFGTAVVVMLVAAVLALAVGTPLGKLVIAWAIRGDPDIPAARATGEAVYWAYLAILCGLCIQIATTSFRAMFVAHQSIGLLPLLEIVESILRITAVCVAMYAPEGSDRLLWLCVALLVGQAVTATSMAVLCLVFYPEARTGATSFSVSALRELSTFTGWSVLGFVSYRIRMVGTPMLLLGAFGSVIAGGYGIAMQVASYQISFSSAIDRVTRPAVAQATGRGDRETVRRLLPSINKFSMLLALLYLVPITIETEAVLDLWLSHKGADAPLIPPETPTFVRLTLLIMGLPWLYAGYHAAIYADGRIKNYMISAIVIDGAGLAVAAAAVLFFGAPPWVVPAIALFTGAFAMVFWVVHISGVLEIPLRDWFVGTWRPVLLVAIPATGAALIAHFLLPQGLLRILAVTAAYAGVAIPLIWFVGVGPAERPHVERLIGAAISRFRGREASSDPPKLPVDQPM